MFRRVAEFHRAFGDAFPDQPILPDPSIRALRRTLLDEELTEFCHACEANDRVEMADALADMCYIIAGTTLAYGVVPKSDEPFESPYDRFLPREEDPPAGMAELLRDCRLDYDMAEDSDHLPRIDLSLMNMLTSIFGVAWRLNIPLNAVFAEVHRSNMAKIMPDGSVLRRSDRKVIKPPGWTPPNIAGVLLTVA